MLDQTKFMSCENCMIIIDIVIGEAKPSNSGYGLHYFLVIKRHIDAVCIYLTVFVLFMKIQFDGFASAK